MKRNPYSDLCRSNPVRLHVDAIRDDLDGLLYQKYDRHLRFVAYASKNCTPLEKNYPTHKIESLVSKWAVVDKLKGFLYGVEFEVKTNNNSLMYLLHRASMVGCSPWIPLQPKALARNGEQRCKCHVKKVL